MFRSRKIIRRIAALAIMGVGVLAGGVVNGNDVRPRAREFGIVPGVLRPGPLNAITDVSGVLVGDVTLVEGEDIRTGVTAILPHGGNLYQNKVPAGVVVGNGFGKFAGTTQIDELGEIETPIILTNTLSVAEGIAGTIEWTLGAAGNEKVHSVNAVVGETNDGYLNAIRQRRITKEDVLRAIAVATNGPVAEGNVGAGTGTQAFGWKGGIGTSSRVLPRSLGGYTIGVLVQTNYGGVLTIVGAPVGKELGSYYLKEAQDQYRPGGSIIVVIATDAPLSDRNLKRLARRAFNGIAKTGSPMTNDSGDYAIAFSSAETVKRTRERRAVVSMVEDLPNDQTSALFQAATECTEEAIYNAILKAMTMKGTEGHVLKELPLDRLKEILIRYGIIANASSK